MAKKMLTVLSMLLLLSFQAEAAEKKGIELRSTAEVDVTVTNEKGEKEVKRMDAAKASVLPGDKVIFTTYYENTGEKPVSDVFITNPISEHMAYVDGSAEGAGTRIEFSVDKGKTFSVPEKLKVRDASGKERPASASDYTHIKWIFEGPIAKGGKGSVSFMAKVK